MLYMYTYIGIYLHLYVYGEYRLVKAKLGNTKTRVIPEPIPGMDNAHKSGWQWDYIANLEASFY